MVSLFFLFFFQKSMSKRNRTLMLSPGTVLEPSRGEGGTFGDLLPTLVSPGFGIAWGGGWSGTVGSHYIFF